MIARAVLYNHVHGEPLPADVAEMIVNVTLMMHFPGLSYEYFAEMDTMTKWAINGVLQGKQEIDELKARG